MRVSRCVGLLLAVALALPACGGGGDTGERASTAGDPAAPAPDTSPDTSPASSPAATAAPPPDTAPLPALVVDGVIGEAALDAVLAPDGAVNGSVLAAYAAEFTALPLDRQQAVVADLSLRAELELAAVSGLEAAVGDRAATEAALVAASAQVREQTDVAIAAAAASIAEPQGLRHGFATPAPPSADGGAVAAIGLMLGYMGLALLGTVAVQASNTFESGESDVREGNGSVIGASVDEVNTELTYTGKQDGVDVEFLAGATIHPCPEPDGSFTIEALVDVKASKGGAGQNARMHVTITGTVGDDAELADKNIENNVQWSDFAGGKGQFIDLTFSGPTGTEKVVANRAGGSVTDSFVKLAALLGVLVGLLIGTKLLEATEEAWKSGRCVKLNVTPSAGPDGLAPSEVVSVLAEPRSKVDGAPTGGSVTATLSAGGASVEPNGSPVPADAASTYTAADEQDKTGTVAYESRSRRGIGKAEVTFSTTKPAAYQVVGGLEDWQIDQVVCDVTKPFVLTSPGVGVAEFSGGLSGTYSAAGVFNFQYSGTYLITLSNGLGTPGTMVATSGGTIAGEAGSGSEVYSLTPATC